MQSETAQPKTPPAGRGKRPVWLADDQIRDLYVAASLRRDSCAENGEEREEKKWRRLQKILAEA